MRSQVYLVLVQIGSLVIYLRYNNEPLITV